MTTIDTPIGPFKLGVYQDHALRHTWEITAYAVDLAEQMQAKAELPAHTKRVALGEDDRALLRVTSEEDLTTFEKAHDDVDALAWLDLLQDAAEAVINALIPEGFYAGDDAWAGGWGFWEIEEDA